ncbi:MAG: FAD-dependent oxidoreductase [Tissierellia bacterium]|nr:FAD-dependent oxidoreductase [Tissierellia bacterium]
MKIIVVGGVAGGATAIARLRRLDEKAEIILLEKGEYVSFANCGLPYYIGGSIEQRDALFVSTPESIQDKYGVEIRTENEVLQIKPEEKLLKILDHKTGKEYEESYDKLLLSTGSRPFIPPVDGIDEDNVFSLWTIPDVDAIYEYIDKKDPKKAVVVGGGFIGLEMAENLVDRGIEVSLVEMADQVMPPLDKDMAKLVENHMISKGVKLYLGQGFAGTENSGKTVLFNSGQKIETDMVLMSIGVRPNNDLAKDAGLELNPRGGIKVNEFQETSDPNIYAVGDVVGVQDYILGGETMIPLAGPANKQGRSVAANMLGKKPEKYLGTMGTSVAKIFDLTVAAVGANEKALERAGKKYKKDYFVAMIHPMSHAGYYPGALPMTLKLIFSADRKILGAQIVGYDGVDKRIDTIATSIHFKGSVDDLTQLELAYAPPYSSAKDPVNFAGYVAVNTLDGLTDGVLYRELKADQAKYQLLDIREDAEVISGLLPNAIHIPLTQLRQRLGELSKDSHYLVYCAVGLRGYVAERVLRQNGFKVSNLIGGYRTYMDMEADVDYVPLMTTEQDKFQKEESEVEEANKVEILNVCGMSCPGPIVQVASAMADLNEGDILEVTATDPGFTRDIASWCTNTGNTLLHKGEEKGKFSARIMKGKDKGQVKSPSKALVTEKEVSNQAPTKKEKTMVIFDGDLDRAIASFIIANGAAAMGNKVHMFFTFWGLSVIRKEKSPSTEKDFMSKMFARMLPKGSKKLGLSKMNFLGAGSRMIRSVMKKKGVTSLEELIKQAQEMGVEMTACQMSMDIMGITKEELIDGVEVGGVASMLNDSDNSNMNLFI